MRLLAATVLPPVVACALAAARALPDDNSIASYRADPEKFAEAWNNHSVFPPFHFSSKDSAAHPGMPSVPMVYSILQNGTKVHSDLGPQVDGLLAVLYPLEMEKLYHGNRLVIWCRERWWLAYSAAAAYLLLLPLGILCMRDRKPFDLKGPLAAWNLFLAVFSGLGMMRMAPHLILCLHLYGFDFTVCHRATLNHGHGPSGLWLVLFVFSKYFELIDTLFLVLRKKKVGFLHWYHHFTVLLYCWHAMCWENPSGQIFATINYAVHFVMYFYYFLAAVCKHPPKWALLVTLMQTSQMFVGIAVVSRHMILLTLGGMPGCDGHVPNLVAALVMYATYLVLFLDFLIKRFCKGRSPNGNSQKLEKKLD